MFVNMNNDKYMKYLGSFPILLVLSVGMMLMISCNSCRSGKSSSVQSEIYQQQSPVFNADSAYKYVEEQVTFGPRVPELLRMNYVGTT